MEKEFIENLSPQERIQRAKAAYMEKESRTTNWEEVEDNFVSQWYFVCKILAHMIPRTFPYCTFRGLVEEIKKDPNFKKKDEN